MRKPTDTDTFNYKYNRIKTHYQTTLAFNFFTPVFSNLPVRASVLQQVQCS